MASAETEEDPQVSRSMTLERAMSNDLNGAFIKGRESMKEDILALVREYPATEHGALTINPHELARQVKDEIITSIIRVVL